MNILEFLQAIDGLGQLWTNDGQFLGVLSSNQYDPNSICNPHSNYGSSYSYESIRNQSGMYGSTWGIYSPFNPNSLCPPAIVYQGRVVGIVTRNRNLFTNGVPLIEPDVLFAVYRGNANTISRPQEQQFTFEQQAALQDMQNRAMLAREMLLHYTETRRQNMEFICKLNEF